MIKLVKRKLNQKAAIKRAKKRKNKPRNVRAISYNSTIPVYDWSETNSDVSHKD